MKIHALVEGPSEKQLLESWGKRMLPGHELRIHPHQGKGTLRWPNEPRPDRVPKTKIRQHAAGRAQSFARGLLDQLPAKLAAFGKTLNAESERVIVLIDIDNDDIDALRKNLERLRAGLSPAPIVEFCFAVEELEAFYLADLKALGKCFPQYNKKLVRSYQPDSICGTWELFGRVIDDDSGNKVAWASAMGARLTTKARESRSPSFKSLCEALSRLVAVPSVAPSRQRKPRRAIAARPRDATGKRER